MLVFFSSNFKVQSLKRKLHFKDCTFYNQEHGKSLNKDEEVALLSTLQGSSKIAIALMLFCGLRPNEVSNQENPPQIEENFIKAVNSK